MANDDGVESPATISYTIPALVAMTEPICVPMVTFSQIVTLYTVASKTGGKLFPHAELVCKLVKLARAEYGVNELVRLTVPVTTNVEVN